MKYFLLLLLHFVVLSSAAQKLIYTNYTKKVGLLSNTVYGIYRTSDGYLWFATDKGISRYNGHQFMHYTLNEGLADIENFFFYEDRQRRLWIGSYNGNISYIQNDVVHSQQNDSTLQTATDIPITSKIYESSDSSIAITFVNSPYVLLYKNNTLKTYNLSAAIEKGLDIQQIKFDGISKFDIKTTRYNCVVDTHSRVLSKHTTPFQQVLRSQKGTTLLVIDEHLQKVFVDGVPLHFDFKKTINTNLNCIYTINNMYYFGTDNGLYIYDRYSAKIVLHAFSDNIISCITEDITGSIWISSLTNGVYQIPKDYQRIHFLPNVYSGQILNATTAGSNIYVQDFKNKIVKINIANNRVSTVQNGMIQNRSSRARLLHFQNDLYVLIDSLVFKEEHLFKKIPYPVLHKKAISNDKQILLNHGYFVNLFDESFKFIHTYSMNGDRIFDIAINKDHAFFSTINKVVQLVDTQTILIKSKHMSGLKSFFVWDPYIIGITHESELKLINRKNDSLLVSRQGIIALKQLANDKYIYASDKNAFLLQIDTTRIGVTNLRTHIIRKDLIPQNSDFMVFSNGQCYIFYDQNLIHFSDSLLKSTSVRNQISISSVFINNEPVSFQAPITIRESRAGSISIRCKALFFELSNPEYFYSIVNANSRDTLWSTFKSEVIDIYNISAGTYSLLIKNEFNEINNMLRFNITKPFHKRPEILIAFFVVILLTSFLIFFRIVETKQKLSTLKHQTLTAEYKSLNSVLNPHFIFNTLSSLQVLIRENKNILAEKYLLLLSSLIRLNMKNTIKEKVSLAREMEIVNKYLEIEKLRFKNQFEYKVSIQESIESSEIFLPPLSIQPIVENSIKHGFFRILDEAGFITIDITKENNTVYVVVQDNGQGLQNKLADEANNRRIHSLDVIRKRFAYFKKLYNVDISIEIKNIESNQNTIGTKVTLSIILPSE
ncbi:MAG: histidine kinase [Bacteroidetes bacterium]|nr:histidine kinase [Bacteroidota bacterium]